MTSGPSALCEYPLRWPYSWTTTVQNRSHGSQALGFNVTTQSVFRSGRSYAETGLYQLE